MTSVEPLQIVTVKGTHRELGGQIGEACAPKIQAMLTSYQEYFNLMYSQLRLRWKDAILQAQKNQPFMVEFLPQYLAELEGMAEGANVPLKELITLNCIEGITEDALHLKCTSIAANEERTETGITLVGHNEDWLPEDEATVYVLRAFPDEEPPFLALNYGGLLPAIGFNASGIAQCCNSVYPADARNGVPRLLVARAVLGKTSLSKALKCTLMKKRAAGYNHLIADRNGELYNMEISANRFAAIYGEDGTIAHSNHYLNPKMQEVEKKSATLIGSRIRYHRAIRLLQKTQTHSVDSFKAILRDHVNFPDSICSHDEEKSSPGDQVKTIASIIMDLDKQVMHVCWGNPCLSEYQPIQLEA